MIEVSELEMRILSELEEAGRENIPTIINTVMEVSGEDTERSEIQEALLNLVGADLIRVTLDTRMGEHVEGLSKEGSLTVIKSIGDHLQFKSTEGHWTGGVRPWPEIASTEAGREKAFEILDERGYQWWRHPPDLND